MDLITLDFETYYDKKYSLKKLTMEEYIRDPKFQVIGVGIKVNNEKTEWASGSKKEIQKYLQGFDWQNSMVVAHNTLFDGAILNWCYGIDPRVLVDTLCMSRALHGVATSASLQALAERYGIGEKGTEVVEAEGKRRSDFTEEELSRYGDYCINDVELTYKLFSIFIAEGFPKQELRVIDMTLRMFTNPTLEVDSDLLHKHLMTIKKNKENLLISSGIHKDDLMSTDTANTGILCGFHFLPINLPLSTSSSRIANDLDATNTFFPFALKHIAVIGSVSPSVRDFTPPVFASTTVTSSPFAHARSSLSMQMGPPL